MIPPFADCLLRGQDKLKTTQNILSFIKMNIAGCDKTDVGFRQTLTANSRMKLYITGGFPSIHIHFQYHWC